MLWNRSSVPRTQEEPLLHLPMTFSPRPKLVCRSQQPFTTFNEQPAQEEMENKGDTVPLKPSQVPHTTPPPASLGCHSLCFLIQMIFHITSFLYCTFDV